MDAAALYTIMALAGLLYAAVVYVLREADPDHGLTPWLVVVGDGLVVAGLYLRLGAEAALELLLLLAIAGVPQIVGYTVARTRRRRRAGERLELR
jgi:hypothetical protein